MRRLLILPVVAALSACLGFETVAAQPPQPAAAAAAAPIPVPEDDPFYDVPGNLDGVANGTVLRSRQITPGFPLPARAWQVLYKTLDHKDRPTATVTTILQPYAPWLGGGARPMLSYQTAEDGIAGKCAPSYAVRSGIFGAGTNSSNEQAIVTGALLKGWTVALPDYQGPLSLFLAAPMEAHGVLDGIRAAKAFKQAGIARDARVGLMGYSGGAYATSVAIQAQPSYAPELRLAGAAIGGVVADVRSTIDAFNAGPASGAIPMGIAVVDRAHPEANIRELITEEGWQKVEASQGDCVGDAVIRNLGFKIENYETVPDALSVPRIKTLLEQNSPLHLGTPTVPVFHYHARWDELAPLAPAAEMTANWCAGGAKVQTTIEPGEHITGLVTYLAPSFRYLSDRFAGRAAPSNCAATP
ncbi:lipase family protein [Nocardioides speluncae]|uniref:lipase family protein n=1 Tax=Nocardioides speluncae TaxID=2670337 RepID=UPI000D68AC2F|nr:lipase family protein [Nocardioides speluncae]